ncbi:NALCN channel auxiliary factor 1-like [Lampris incognitus]|uniref:NALCN channel auxiliary factor 1-like n=1 Tax=Lampris incognitus TaxID=2546036 RepID=UPI0024B51098|nr:NALCN channel auxiliary factor 1-like [Lampris incognitus]XP_056157669.1 NALCN channel auxiliary factor 1-like [Lampris incognitus]
MTRGARTCWQQDDGFQIWLAPRENEKPFTDSERAQRWRLSLASLLFFTILLSDHLWFCAEAKLTRTRDKFSSPDMGVYTSNHPSPRTHLAHSSLRGNEDAIFIGNSTNLWRIETCQQDSLSKNCFAFGDADHLCKGLSEKEGTRSVNMSDLYLSFCNSYSLLDLFYGSTRPDDLNCSLDVLSDGDMTRCSLCIQAYQRYDQHAQEKYDDFELMTQKYETDAYSVRTCMEQCKMAYKPWLCAQYFPTTQRSCQKKMPCHQYCLEVQQSCPFILPDNDDLIHGGSPSFICTGLLGEHPPDNEAECCDVRWDSKMDSPSGGTLKRTATPCHPQGASVTDTAPPRLCNGRLKICLLALVLLHTVIIISVSHNSTFLGGATIFPPDESSSKED